VTTARYLPEGRPEGELAAATGDRRAAAAGLGRDRGGSWGGISIAVVSAATFGTSGTFGTSLLDAGWTPGAAVLVRITLAALMLTVPAVIGLRGRWRQLRRSWRTAVAYGLVGVAGCQVCYFNAIEHMPVGIALLIEYTGSILVVAWLWLRHGQRPRRLTVLGAAAAIGGLALMVVIGSGSGESPAASISLVGFAWAMTAAVSMAVYFVLSAGPAGPSRPDSGAPSEAAEPQTQPLPPIALAWAGMWVGAAFLGILLAVHVLPFGASSHDVVLLRHQVPLLVPIVGIALLSTACGYSTGIVAARRLGAKLASFIGMAEILFAVVYAWALLGQLPSVTQFLGGALILAGVTLVKVDER
jgi:drug/metabolite transporter (DMT)-like permease